jgi:hypothetical protein
MSTKVKPSMFASLATQEAIEQKFLNARDAARQECNPYGMAWVALLPASYDPKYVLVDCIYNEDTAAMLSQFVQITAVFASDSQEDIKKHSRVAYRYAKEYEQNQAKKG